MTILSKKQKAGIIATVVAGIMIIAFVVTIVAMSNQDASIMAGGIDGERTSSFQTTSYTFVE